ncbi:MAG: type II secretion system protein [Nitrospirae bacterium]|nr:type II secretion system protein [Magnetococcales bacterium]
MNDRLDVHRPGEAGFTLVELIIVIIVLGVLAATLLPKYMDVSGEAKTAVSTKMHGDINSTLHSVHGVHLAQQAAGTTPAPTAITTCLLALGLLEEDGGVTCSGTTTLKFPDDREATLTPEDLTKTPPDAPKLGDLLP